MRYYMLMCVAIVLMGGPAEAQETDEWRAAMDRGNAAQLAGNYIQAAEGYRAAIKLAEAFPETDDRRIFGLNSLAMMYDALGRWTDSEAAYRRALDAAQRSTGEKGPDYPLIQSNLASVYIEMGQTERGEKMLRQALVNFAPMEEQEETRVAMVRNVLGELLLMTERYREANQLLERCVRVLAGHPEAWSEYAVALNNLGLVRTREGRMTEAQRLLGDAIAIMEEHMGPDHPMLTRTLNNLATTLYQSGKREEAGQALRRALSIAERRLGEEHPVYGALLRNYADYLRNRGEKAEAKSLQARATKILKASHRSNGIGSVVDISALRPK